MEGIGVLWLSVLFTRLYEGHDGMKDMINDNIKNDNVVNDTECMGLLRTVIPRLSLG